LNFHNNTSPVCVNSDFYTGQRSMPCILTRE
jgi:hypothetical protein